MRLVTPLLEFFLGRSGASERVVERFLAHPAELAETAMPFTPLGDGQRHQFEKLRARGVIISAGKFYYLDRRAYEAMRARQRRVRGAAVVTVAGLAVAGVVALSEG